MAAGTQKPARLHNNKCYVFQCSLNKLLQDANKVPLSKVACRKCTSRQRSCVCDTINGSVCKTPTYEIEQLVQAKASLTEIRSALDNVDIEKWSVHTKLLDTTSLVAKHVSEITTTVNGRKELGVEMVTNGWLKLNEMLHVFNIIDVVKPNLTTQGGTLYSFHISECPGAFIAALNHNVKLKNNEAKLVWKATSLNPYNETNSHQQVLAEDILYRETWPQWLRGADETGNIIKSANIEYIWNHTSRSSIASNNSHASSSRQQPILVDVCTADGSFNCQADPNNQERITAPLKFSELVCALGLIRIGGVFIIKLFSLLEEPSISIVAILSICFKSIKVYKPLLSKASSGEIYVICIDYCGITSVLLCALCQMVDEYARAHQPGATITPPAIVPLAWLPDDFKSEYIDCATMFTQIQCRCLKQSMSQYKAVLDENALYKQKREFAEQYIVQFNIKPINPDSKLVKYQSFSCQVPISGKDTSSLGHVAKRSFPDLQGRRNYDIIYKLVQELRRTAFKKNCKYFFCLDFNGSAVTNSDVAVNGVATTAATNGTRTSTDPTDAIQDNVYKAVEFATLHKLNYVGIDLDGDVITSLDKSNKQLYASLLASLKAQEYIGANWFTAGNLKAHSFKSSHFCCNDLLFDIIRIRTLASASASASGSHINLAPTTWQDELIISSSFGEALSDVNSTPSSGAIHLAMVIKRLLNIGRYQYYLEITADASHEFPAICILKRHGIKGSLLYDFPSSQEPPYLNFESPQELKLVLDNLLGQGIIDKCLEVNYKQLLMKHNSSYKDLVADINDSILKHSCDFIFCNPWTNSPGKSSATEVTAHELESQHLFVAQIIQALHCLNDGGDLVVSTSTTLSRFTAGLLLVLSSGFDKVDLYTPETVAPWTLQSYIVCKGYTDRDKSTCRYFFQCLWDAISMHCKSGLAIISTAPPKYFTQIAKLLYKYNVRRLLQQLEDLKVHFQNKSNANSRQQFSLGQVLEKFNLAPILFPRCLVESQGPCKLLEASVEEAALNDPKGTKRSREDGGKTNGVVEHVARDGYNDGGYASSVDEDLYNEDSNSIWSQDDLDDEEDEHLQENVNGNGNND